MYKDKQKLSLEDVLKIDDEWELLELENNGNTVQKLSISGWGEVHIYTRRNKGKFEWLASYDFNEKTHGRLHEAMWEIINKELLGDNECSGVYLAHSCSN